MIELPVTLTSTGGAVSFAYPVPLGYTKNKGVYRLLVTAEGEWDGLTIRCFWHLPGGTDPASSLVQDGAVDVPASVTAHPGNGCITFEGSDGVKTVTSADLRYRVGSNSGTEDGTMPEPGTPAWEQLVSETAVAVEAVQKQIGNLDDLTTKAKETLVAAVNEAARTGSGGAGSITMRTDGGYIQYSTDDGSTWENLIALAELKGEPGEKGEDGSPGQNGADGAPGADGYSPTASVEQIADGAKITITDKSGTTEAVVKNGKDGANGRDGADGQPGRDGTDGAPGRDGVDGQPGKDGTDGTDGITPTIGDNGNWFLGATDTGISAKGVKGNTGDKGEKGDTGPQGPVGPQGPQGAAGPQGPAGKDGSGMDITGATVGQIAKISAVDENGKPTAWVPVDMPGGSDEQRASLIFETTTTERVSTIDYRTPDGFYVRNCVTYVWIPKDTEISGRKTFFMRPYGNVGGAIISNGIRSDQNYTVKAYTLTPYGGANEEYSNVFASKIAWFEAITIGGDHYAIKQEDIFTSGVRAYTNNADVTFPIGTYMSVWGNLARKET